MFIDSTRAKLTEFSAAIEDYTTMLQRDSRNGYVLRLRGEAYASMNEYEKAIADYEAALKIDPDDFMIGLRLQDARAMLAQKPPK
jgi:tetratricopeptide (TPR) repeat protein